MSKAKQIMNENISDDEKLNKMKQHFDNVDDWLNKNQSSQDKYSQDELAEMLKEILDYIVELTKEVIK